MKKSNSPAPANSANRKNRLPIYIGGIAAVLFIIVTLLVLNGTLDSWNTHVYKQIASLMSPSLTHVMIFISFFGQWFIILSAAILLLIMPKTRKSLGIPLTFTTFSATALGYVLKRIITIPRPAVQDVLVLLEASGYGHPSGHILRTSVFLGTCAILIWTHTRQKSIKVIASILAVFLSCLMGFSRIYLGVHTATDTIAAYLAGIFVLSFSVILWQLTCKFSKKTD